MLDSRPRRALPATKRRGPKKKNFIEIQRNLPLDECIINDKIIFRNVEERTEESYGRELENWDDLLAVRAYGGSVDSLATLKEFMYRLGNAKKQGKGEIPYNTMLNCWKRFTAGYRRERGPIRDDYVYSVRQLIQPKGQIGKRLNVVPDSGPKAHATVMVFVWLGEFVWAEDPKIYKSPKTRVDLWALICTYIYTTARVSDYIESTARRDTEIGELFKDTQLLLFTNENGSSELSIQLKKYLKGKDSRSSRLPQTHVHEGNSKTQSPLFMNPILFQLARFCSMGALRDYKGIQGMMDLLDKQVSIPKKGLKREGEIIHWDHQVENMPMFPGENGKVMKADVFHRCLRELMIRAHFPNPPGIHSFRGEGLHDIDLSDLYSDTQRQKHAGHDNSTIHGQHYAARNSGVDGQSAYLREQPRTADISYKFRSFETRWEPTLWQSLPVSRQEQLHQSDEYQEIHCRLQNLLADIKQDTSNAICQQDQKKLKMEDDSDEIAVDLRKESRSDDRSMGLQERRLLKEKLQKLEKEELRKMWDVAPKNSASTGEFTIRGVDLPFHRVKPVLPERTRLAELLLVRTNIRSAEGREVLRTLVQLYDSKSEVKPRSGLDPSMCSCSKPKSDQVHIYKCMKKQMREGDFCFFCNKWFSDETSWAVHCKETLTSRELPMELGWGKVYGAIIPGYCIICLWNCSISCSERIRAFTDRQEWEDHVASHDISALSICPDPRCSQKFDTGQDLVNHIHDIHRTPKSIFTSTRAKRKATCSDCDGCLTNGDFPPLKKICLNHMVFEGWVHDCKTRA